MRLRRLLATAATLLAAAAHAQTPAPAELDRALAGRWVGHLEYRDYRSDRRVQLPMRTTVAVADDGATLLRQSRFDDGPARGEVLVTTVSLYDATGASVTAASFRRGRAVELATETARVLEHDGITRWSAQWLQRGMDGGQAAEIRVTVTRRDDELRSVKEVRPLPAEGADVARWAFRNETVLRRLP